MSEKHNEGFANLHKTLGNLCREFESDPTLHALLQTTMASIHDLDDQIQGLKDELWRTELARRVLEHFLSVLPTAEAALSSARTLIRGTS